MNKFTDFKTYNFIIRAFRRFSAAVAVLSLAMLCTLQAWPLDPSRYAASSRLASGKWAKLQVSETGMQLIPNATLRNLGFSDPSKVRVFGYGGRMLPETLDASMPDDLPLAQSVVTPAGIVFFGHSTAGWTRKPSGIMEFTHTLNPYSSQAFYFISDSQDSIPDITDASSPESVTGDPITVFTERILHENDLIAPSNTGRVILGEDFRSQTTRNFPFNLPGNTGDARMRMAFGAKVTNGQSSFIVTANGNLLPATQADKIPGISSSETFLNYTKTVKSIPDPGDKLNLSIKYNYSGAIFTAALDYIEIEYPRLLQLASGELYFSLSPSSPAKAEVRGCSQSTVIWDVTDPADIKNIPFTLSEQTASFSLDAGYHEFVAFEPSKISRKVSPAGKVSNQDLHALAAPGMLIISPQEYLDAARRIAALHKETDGLHAEVLTPQQIYNEFSSGTPDVTAFRKLLKMWFDRANGVPGQYPGYCLILSRPTYDNKMVTLPVKRAGYPRIPIWQSPDGFSESSSYSMDDYIGMLADSRPGYAPDFASQTIHVAVGRMPVKSVMEANNAVAKLEKYVKSPALGAWRNNVLVIADDEDNAAHLDQAEVVINRLRKSGNGNGFLYEKLYLDSYPRSMTTQGATYPEAKQRLLDKLSEGVSFLNYIGHANAREWGHEKLLTWTDITSLKNSNLPFIYAATCEFMNWDSDEVSGAEEMWLNPNAGTIGMICPSRKVYISLNGTLNANTAPYVFAKSSDGLSQRIGDIMIAGKNATTNETNKLRYGLIGDPAMRLPSPTLNVVVDSIAGVSLDNADDLPVIQARSKVEISGHVGDINGNLASDFSGTLSLSLFDAEKVVETYGNGENGKVSTYNDRKTRLLSSKVKAENGTWKAVMLLPAEIENNFSPALISLYASDNLGREANGACEDLYVYGFDENALDDFDAPTISEFYLNLPSFADGGESGPNPVVYAKFTDPSGINISDAGIGHDMTLTLDGTKIFDDVVLHFNPDPTSAEAGSIEYPLSDIEPGEHDLSLTVWDNANNSATATLKFNVRAGWQPTISGLTTDVSPASSSVNFLIDTDSPYGAEAIRIEVFDLMGRRVWLHEDSLSGSSAPISIGWDLRDYSGCRVARGIYLYRATIVTAEGAEISKTNKLAVTAG